MTDAMGRQILLIGLSHRNLDKLRADGLKGHVKINGDEVGIAGWDLMITAGESEAAIAHALQEFIGPETKVHVDEKLKS